MPISVSPTSIRSRILKVYWDLRIGTYDLVSPTSIRSRILKVSEEIGDGLERTKFHPRRSVRGY